jgi:hypothetical protein
MGPIAPSGSCNLGVSFAPQGQGSRSATLQIASNDPNSPATVTLSGTGGELPQGPPGQTGATGQTGLQGAAGRAGKIELVTCKPVKKSKRRKCTTKLVSSPVKFTTGTAQASVRVSRAGVLYATGYTVSTARGSWQLVLTRRRDLQPGRYTLTLRTRHGHRWDTERRSITLS